MRFFALVLIVAASVSAQQDDGANVFASRCGACHGADGRGGERGPKIRSDRGDLAKLIHEGVNAMPAIELSAGEIKAVAEFVAGVIASGENETPALPFPKLSGPSRDWPTYHGEFSGNRQSPLKLINTGNIASLAPRWIFNLPTQAHHENTPIVVGGIMYVTAVNEAFALDARNGRQLWHYRRPRSKGLVGDASSGINRGVAILGNRLFMGTDNAHLIALDRTTGRLLWDSEMADSREHYGSTSAPLVVHDLVVMGASGGDEGARGFLNAYNPATGERVWRFWTVPAAGEPLADTWRGKAIAHGCASTWFTGTYDPVLDILYWTTGNPCPDYNGDERMGDNLYSDSVLAIRPATGKLAWYFQFTPHDLHDWDATQTPMLVDRTFHGRERKLIVHGNRNGFLYVLDRTTGEFLQATPFVKKLTWATGIGADGRPQLNPAAIPTREGVRVCPAVEGATNWMSAAYNPGTKLYYLMTLEKCTVFSKTPGDWVRGKSYYNGDTKDVPDEPGQKILRAIDIETGKTVWEHAQDGPADSWGGVLSTDGGLVFFCEDGGAFVAADSRTGKVLWRFPANVSWKASPMTYMVDGRQFVVVEAGSTFLALGLP